MFGYNSCYACGKYVSDKIIKELTDRTQQQITQKIPEKLVLENTICWNCYKYLR